LAYATVVLPTEVGGLNESGMLDETAESRERLDVAEETPGRRQLAAARGGASAGCACVTPTASAGSTS
jgi:hypothetical protein